MNGAGELARLPDRRLTARGTVLWGIARPRSHPVPGRSVLQRKQTSGPVRAVPPEATQVMMSDGDHNVSPKLARSVEECKVAVGDPAQAWRSSAGEVDKR
jgi:hypothetical protein